MELIIRIILITFLPLVMAINLLVDWFLPQKKPTYPPIRDPILLKSIAESLGELRQKKLTSTQLVQAYIARIKEVNPSLNAVIEDRFEEALKDAKRADQLIGSTVTNEQIIALFTRYPLLGIPFTVKEQCGVKGLSFVVGNIHRIHEKCETNGEVVELLCSAGCIPLLVSANPEFCLSFETITHTHGRCHNPYDLYRISAGSSGGEGALNGSGSSLFGLGSDLLGSIRMPALFCGIFGHKPTGGLVSVKGTYPYCKDSTFSHLLQLGPMTRFARDMPLLLEVMVGNNAHKLKFNEYVPLKDIKIYYAYGFGGLNGLMHPPIDFDIKLAIRRALLCFEKRGLRTKEVNIKHFHNSFEIGLVGVFDLVDVPSVMTCSSVVRPSREALIMEFLKALIGRSIHTKEALFTEVMKRYNAFIPSKNMNKLRLDVAELKNELLDLLGTNGVLFFPTNYTTATVRHSSITNSISSDLIAIFNTLGFPATHIPMGLNNRGMPIGFQVVAAPYQDKICLQIAAELDDAFGGWQPPLPHDIKS